MSSIVHMWPVSQQTWTCQQSAVWETATVPLVCLVKSGNAGLQRHAPIPEKGYGDWLAAVCWPIHPLYRSEVAWPAILCCAPFFPPCGYKKTLKVLWILQTQKDLLILLKWTKNRQFGKLAMYAGLPMRCFWWKVWFILLNSGTLFWFLLFYIMFT